jgi:hypothetical protein
MGEARRWSVEAKEFEVSIKGGLLGVRIVEIRNKKRRSIFVHRDEISWLVGALEVAAEVDTSEVFWDQSRAGYIRLTTQRCANKHGRFLFIEEYDGRRRSGTILVPEGWTGQGWARMISELRRACSALKMGRGYMEDKPMKVGRGSQEDRPATVKVGSRSFAEVVGTSKAIKEKEEKGSLVSTEAVAGGGLPVLGIPANDIPGREMAPAKSQYLSKTAINSVALGGCNQKVKGLNRKLEEGGAVHRGSDLPAVRQSVGDVNTRGRVGEACQGKKPQLKGRKEGPINAKQELGILREWLCQLRGEVEAGLVKVDRVLNKLVIAGPGQAKKINAWIPKPKRKIWHKKKQVGLGISPNAGKSPFKPSLHMDDGVGSSDDMGSSKGLISKPNSEHSAGIGKEAGLGLNPVGPKRADEGEIEDLGLEDAPDFPEPVSFHAGDKEKDGEAGKRSEIHFTSGGSDVERVSRVEEAQREGGFQSTHSENVQKMPTGVAVSSGTHCDVPKRGCGVSREDKSSQNRPVCSWVAGRTGFGPVNAEKTKGLCDPAAIPETRVDPTALEGSEQAELISVVDRTGDNASAGVHASVQFDISKVPSEVMEVYHRREVLTQGIEKGGERGRGVGPEELAGEVVASDAGSGLVIEELEDPFVKKNMTITLEVSTVAGLSCDGQEGKKEECLRRIVVEKHEMGRGEGSVSSEFQQEEDSQSGDWGNCSDYEA